ncbi:MAG: YkgJ family cysteine cluster protein [Deltaproteobacteria bacterium]|nr:YkgJ family cysteine cluster protein [Deltaproteobacteria bacterium]
MSEDGSGPDIFSCQRCGDCCKGYGGAFVTADDIHALSGYLGIDPLVLEKNYCRQSGRRPVLGQNENGYCIFWDGLCTIHAVKPRMCRQWPFIEGMVVDIRNWRAAGESCPGIRTDLSDETVKAIIKKKLSEAVA